MHCKKAVSKPMVLVIQRNVGVLETPGLRGRASITEARTGFQEPGRPQFHTNPKRIFSRIVHGEYNIFRKKMEVIENLENMLVEIKNSFQYSVTMESKLNFHGSVWRTPFGK